MYAIETVDSLKLAELLNNYMHSVNRTLNIMIQVNTSKEERKCPNFRGKRQKVII